MKKAPTPRELGYRMPAEFEPHEATWLAWPHMRFAEYWGDKLESVQNISLQLMHALAESEKVHLMVVNRGMEEEVRRKAQQEKISLEHVVFYGIRTSDVWTRDFGPIYVVNKDSPTPLAITHWFFNAWGKEEYRDLSSNAMVPAKIHEIDGDLYFNAEMILEGGSIEVNGQGTLLTTKAVLRNKNREAFLSKAQVEKKLKEYLNVRRIIYLEQGLVNDDTDGHVDNLARFIDPRTLVIPLSKERGDENYEILRDNFHKLKESAHQEESFKIIPVPSPHVEYQGKKLAASYTNFYIANKAVIVPIFNNQHDQQALSLLQELFPTRKITPIKCLDLLLSGGTIHCITQQQPALS